MDGTATTPADLARLSLPSAKRAMKDYGLLAALVIIVAFFQIATNGSLLQPLNVTNLLLQNSYIVIMALGMLMVIVSGHIDLSVGSIVGVVGALAGMLIVQYQFHLTSATLLCLAAGALDRCDAGVLDRLLGHAVLHRDTGWDACVSRRHDRHARAASRLDRSRRPSPGSAPGFMTDLFRPNASTSRPSCSAALIAAALLVDRRAPAPAGALFAGWRGVIPSPSSP